MGEHVPSMPAGPSYVGPPLPSYPAPPPAYVPPPEPSAAFGAHTQASPNGYSMRSSEEIQRVRALGQQPPCSALACMDSTAFWLLSGNCSVLTCIAFRASALLLRCFLLLSKGWAQPFFQLCWVFMLPMMAKCRQIRLHCT